MALAVGDTNRPTYGMRRVPWLTRGVTMLCVTPRLDVTHKG